MLSNFESECMIYNVNMCLFVYYYTYVDYYACVCFL